MPASPAQGLFIVGNDTEVGKTQITAGLCYLLHQAGNTVAPRKPVASGYQDFDGQHALSDDAILAASVAHSVSVDVITRYRFQAPLAPHFAARLEGKTLTMEMLHRAALQHLTPESMSIIEGAGGFYSPMAEDGLCSDLAVQMQLPIVLVISNQLGCINQTLMSVRAIEREGLMLHSIILNQTTPSTENTLAQHAETICQYTHHRPFTVPYFKHGLTPRWQRIAYALNEQGWNAAG